ncbi:[FeFe] hydrogenase H-cluster maturation GTPase HydF [Clostridium frigidicarnis]|uniref:[FeFe] hydrogenase H-cluster maturation GTPase HydF n=1 Tax=Clostridium frigidicarnis TaxID=84698 RepID=A0A1I0Z7H2_9CLOT|nr:[FeFe] hydrogenase H-cluster maturation GTPase HydF [Clostridium frigidicarnis]SFB21471.1 [FeFe] hydrogenase H-cluster maturation GTPase HydF [Clostridium frigidicarnis]
MLNTPKANRLHIAIFGKRNAGKSSLLNAITNQNLSLVSDVAGTTTDPVFKAMELLPIGPVMLVDTAGLDDEGTLGELRIEKTLDVMNKTDLALLVFTGENNNFSMELDWFKNLKDKNIPVIGVINKIDEFNLTEDNLKESFPIPFVSVSAIQNLNIGALKEAIIKYAPSDFENPTIVGDILNPKDMVIVVAPQDIQAPKGRLILPQVQIIRDILDHDAMALTVKDSELKDILSSLNRKPDFVITDSQIFKKVNEIVPKDIPLTSFSVLMARYKGDLDIFKAGAKAINNLKPNDKILIAEACTHHSLKNDIAREKIPMWLENKVNGKLLFDVKSGSDFPKDLTEYKLIVHCGSCMFTRKELLSRLSRCVEQNVPITNFGVAIAEINGILDRVTTMF